MTKQETADAVVAAEAVEADAVAAGEAPERDRPEAGGGGGGDGPGRHVAALGVHHAAALQEADDHRVDGRRLGERRAELLQDHDLCPKDQD